LEPILESELLRPALEASPVALLIVDTHGTITLVSRELERLFGYDRGELSGQRVEILLPEALREVHAEHRRPFAQAPGPRSHAERGALVGRRKDGALVNVTIALQPMHTKDGVFVLASVSDPSAGAALDDVQRAALETQIEFERLVAALSFQFINLPDDQIPDAMREGLSRVGEQLALDRATLYAIDSSGIFSDVAGWTRAGVPPVETPVSGRERFPWVLERLLAGEAVTFSRADEIPSEVDRESYAVLHVKSGAVLPLSVNGRLVGAMGFCIVTDERPWPVEVVQRLRVIGSVFDQVLARRERDEAVRAASKQVQELRDQLQAQNLYLRREQRERLGLTGIVGESPAIRRVLEQIHQVAATDATVLLLGETGTGKELLATTIHELGARRGRPMVRVNCAAIPATLMESELFGREKGAFTGSLARQIGRFELADHSTIFLDEIGDLPADLQVKLLRVLEEHTIERLGSPRPITVDARIIAATHRNLEQRIAEGAFREDLYYRLNVFPILVPPLRERVEDIPLLLWRFVEEFSRTFGKRIDSIDKETVTALQRYAWPGNIRELRNVVERAMIVATSRRLSIPLPQVSAAATRRSAKLLDVEREHIRAVLESTGWRIRGSGGAADRLGLKPTTLETRMAKLNLKRPGRG
jgi:PAS domain S-box-containing protein